MFSTFAIVRDGKEEGIKCFFKADLVIVGGLMIDGSKLILRVIEGGQGVFWGHVGDEDKGADVEPEVDEFKLVY